MDKHNATIRMELQLRQGRGTRGFCFLAVTCIAKVETTTLSALWFWSHAAGVWRNHCHQDIKDMRCLLVTLVVEHPESKKKTM